VLLMVYIGGAGHFFGAVPGAIVITWLQVSLSHYTSAWQLYLGLFFMAIVLYAPGGLAGLVMMHAPLARAGALTRVLRAYALAAPAALAMALGAGVLLEIAYRRSTQPEAGAAMKLFGIAMDTATPWPWLAAALVMVAGALWLRRLRPLVAAAWHEAGEPR
jgi:branched-chain amino acid transport system permease protein